MRYNSVADNTGLSSFV